MKIKRVEVHASHTFNNPNESYSNYQVSARLDAEIEPGERYDEAVRKLQIEVDHLVATHRSQIIAARDIERRALVDKQKRREDELFGRVAHRNDDESEGPF